MNSAREPKSSRELALRNVAAFLGDETTAGIVVDQVFAAVEIPDRVMLEAGRAELALALPRETKKQARALAGVMWRAMLDRARR